MRGGYRGRMRLTVVSGDGRVLDPEQPLLHADDLAALRGDGVFETLLIRDGHACLVQPHLERLVAGAAESDLPAPDVPALRRAIDVAVAEWGADREGMLRIVHSRGRESRPGEPTCFLTVGDVPERVAATRRDGLAAITLEWSPPRLARVKSLAYAGHAAAARTAAARGAGEAILISGGSVLEGSRSSVVVARDGELLTPPRSLPILPGVTAAALGAREASLTVDELHSVDGVWLVSAVTLAARVHTLDGNPLPPPSIDVLALVDSLLSSEDG